MPKSNPYKQGSIVYFQGDRADKIFVLQNGIVDLCVKDIETGKETNDLVQRGEFFGVKSALGGYPREERATAVADSLVMSFTVPEFEAFARNNTRIAFQMLKVFSRQLRDVNKRLSTLTQETDGDPDDGLYSVAEYYYKQKKIKQAEYVLRKYIESYPQGNNIADAKTKYTKLASGKL
ncbi:MAG: Crp/Fnr family transcriptional regulator [Spirochaetaceae bacterium]|jgi:CRP-like cAMP-binding protein|nr:Crp/Fnr family transcriptional regulator [Spirochaetaceae bacterium]